MNPKDIPIVEDTGVNPEPALVIPGNNKREGMQWKNPDALIMGNLETSLANTVNKARGNASVAIVERFIKTTESTMFAHT